MTLNTQHSATFHTPDLHSNSFQKTGFFSGGTRHWLLSGLFSLLLAQGLNAQTLLLDPAGAGGFELGTTFADNGWSVDNGTVTNKWHLGTVPTAFPATRSAFVSNDNGTTHAYTNTATSVVHFWRDITFPAGETNATISFSWVANGETSSSTGTVFDALMVSVAPTTYTPAASSTSLGGSGLSSPATTLQQLNLQNTTVQTANITIPPALLNNCTEATTLRIIFTWKNDTSGGSNPPAAIDNIAITSFPPLAAGTYSVGPTGNFTSLGAALNRLSGAISDQVILELQSAYSSSVETFPLSLRNFNFICGSTTANTVTIRPESGAANLAITSAASQTLDINGGNNYIIDGRPGGTGTAKELTISNTSTSGVAIRYINEGSNNTLRYCTVTGVNTSTSSGVVVFSTTTGANGNDNNLIEYCDIKDGATTPATCIYGSGTSASPNNFITISNCNIFNYFLASGNSAGINLSTGHSDITISNNSFYQTASRAQSGISRVIQSGGTTNANWTVTNNFFGGTAANCGGGALTFTGATSFQAISFTGTTAVATPTLIQGNTIANINITSSNSTTEHNAIACATGSFNILNNTIGSTTTGGSIIINTSGSNQFNIIKTTSSTGSATNTISNNTISGISMAGSTAAMTFRGIQVSSATSAVTISGNTIGGSLASSISNPSAGNMTGIVCSGSVAATYNVTGNTISNLVSTNNTGTSIQVKGIEMTGTLTSHNISGNTVTNLSLPPKTGQLIKR